MAIRKLDISKLSKESHSKLISYLRDDIINRAMWATEELNFFKDIVERAVDSNYNTRIPPQLQRIAEEAADDPNLPTVDEEEYDTETDEYVKLKDPFLARMFISWVRAIKNSNLNPNNDWFGLNRTTDPFFRENNILDFIEKSNTGWVNYFNKENKRFNYRIKYAKLVPEFVAHGYTVGLHTWDTVDDYCNLISPGTRNFGMYPITDDLNNTNKVFRYEISYADLIDNAEWNPDGKLQEYIKPYNLGNTNTFFTDSTKKTLSYTPVKYGDVRITEVKVRSLYIDGDTPEDPPIIAKNCWFVLALEATTTGKEVIDDYNYKSNDFVLAAYQEVEEDESGEMIACFNDTFPGDFPGKGPLIPYLYDQAHLNYLRQAHVRIIGLVADPPYTEEALDGIDDTDTSTYEFGPGKNFGNKKVSVLVPGEFINAINYIIQAKKIITEDAENTNGMNKNRQGTPFSGRRSAAEVNIVDNQASDSEADVIHQFDDLVLKRSMIIRTARTQRQLKAYVDKALKDVKPEQRTPELYEAVLPTIRLFERMRDWQGLDEMYRDFYNQYTREKEEDDQLIKDTEELEKQIAGMGQAIVSALPAAVKQGAIQDVQSYQAVNAQIEEMKQQRKMLLNQYRAMVSTIKDMPDIPKPSNYLYYNMLVASITASDIDAVAGTATAKLQEEKAVIDTLLEYSQTIPEMRMLTDFEKIVGNIAKMLKKKPSDFLLSPAERSKAKIELQQFRQQAMMQLAQQQAMQQMQTEQPE